MKKVKKNAFIDALKVGNYSIRVYESKAIVEVFQPKYAKVNGEVVQQGFELEPLFSLSFRAEQFGYGLIAHLAKEKDMQALENFGAISFAMNSLFASKAEFRTDVQAVINKYLNPPTDGEKSSK